MTALLQKPYDYNFTVADQEVLGVTLGTTAEGLQERPVLVRVRRCNRGTCLGSAPGADSSPMLSPAL